MITQKEAESMCLMSEVVRPTCMHSAAPQRYICYVFVVIYYTHAPGFQRYIIFNDNITMGIILKLLRTINYYVKQQCKLVSNDHISATSN